MAPLSDRCPVGQGQVMLGPSLGLSGDKAPGSRHLEGKARKVWLAVSQGAERPQKYTLPRPAVLGPISGFHGAWCLPGETPVQKNRHRGWWAT